jgi:hypothetical protein
MRRALACSNNNPGYYCAGSSDTECTSGYYCNNGSTRVQCAAGYKCIGSTSNTQGCPTGFYSTLGDHLCHVCPAGKSCTTSAASNCGSGTYSLERETSCTTCPQGYKCPSPSQAPERCVHGYYQTS